MKFLIALLVLAPLIVSAQCNLKRENVTAHVGVGGSSEKDYERENPIGAFGVRCGPYEFYHVSELIGTEWDRGINTAIYNIYSVEPLDIFRLRVGLGAIDEHTFNQHRNPIAQGTASMMFLPFNAKHQHGLVARVTYITSVQRSDGYESSQMMFVYLFKGDIL